MYVDMIHSLKRQLLNVPLLHITYVYSIDRLPHPATSNIILGMTSDLLSITSYPTNALHIFDACSIARTVKSHFISELLKLAAVTQG